MNAHVHTLVKYAAALFSDETFALHPIFAHELLRYTVALRGKNKNKKKKKVGGGGALGELLFMYLPHRIYFTRAGAGAAQNIIK